jgi:hypothetical protein
MYEEIHRRMKLSSCFHREVCTMLPCACAQSLADVSRDALAAKEAEIKALTEALRPFAGLTIYPDVPDHGVVIVTDTSGGIIDTGKNRVSVGDLRRAERVWRHSITAGQRE